MLLLLNIKAVLINVLRNSQFIYPAIVRLLYALFLISTNPHL